MGEPTRVERALAAAGSSRALHDLLTPRARAALKYSWRAWARPMVQLSERVWLGQDLHALDDLDFGTAFICMGRGAGKTRLALEYVRAVMEDVPGSQAIVMHQTAGDARKVLGFGPIGFARICPPWNSPDWAFADQSFTWANGSKAFLFSSDAPESPRSFEVDVAVLDEAAYYRNLGTIISNVRFALRRGKHPRLLVTTTPRASGSLRAVRDGPGTIVVTGSLYDNSRFLPASFIKDVELHYKGTSLERSELNGDPASIDENEGAVFRRVWIDRNRVRAAPPLKRVVVGVDPAASTAREHDVAGVVAVGLGMDGHGYVLADGSGESAVLTPREWARAAIDLYHRFHATHLVEETNKGGALASELVKAIDPSVRVKPVGASVPKEQRATLVASQAEANRLHFVGSLPDLEDECVQWIPGAPGAKSPGRLDALVHACLELLVRPAPPSQRGLNDEPGIPRCM